MRFEMKNLRRDLQHRYADLDLRLCEFLRTTLDLEVAGSSGPKTERLGRDEGIERSNRRLRDGDPHLPVGVHGGSDCESGFEIPAHLQAIRRISL
jgi:hypothetical protein